MPLAKKIFTLGTSGTRARVSAALAKTLRLLTMLLQLPKLSNRMRNECCRERCVGKYFEADGCGNEGNLSQGSGPSVS
jgi:hypothetical protein